MEFKFSKPFDAEKREQLATQVVRELKNELVGLCVNWSHESGFSLPLTEYWAGKDYGDQLNRIIKYHDSRQLRFKLTPDSKYVTGLRFKDGINYWSDDEVAKLIEQIEKKIDISNELI